MKTSRSKRGTYLVPLSDGKTADFDAVTKIIGSTLNKVQLFNWATKLIREQVIRIAAQLSVGWTGTISELESRIEAELKAQGRADKNESKRAMNIGQQAHHLIETALREEMGQEGNHKDDEMAPEAVLAFERWKRWRSTKDFKPMFIEQVVWSERNKYAGTLDLVTVNADGTWTVYDWKVSSGVYPEAMLQNAAYRWALIEMGHVPPRAVVGGVIVRLDKEENPKNSEWNEVHIEPEESASDLEGFLCVRDIHEWLKTAPPRIKEQLAKAEAA